MGNPPLSFPVLPDALSHQDGGGGRLRVLRGNTMITSMLTGQGMRTGRERLAKAPRLARKGFIRALAAGAAAGVTLTAAGLAGGAAPAMAATQSPGPPSYNPVNAGYNAQGRWFRFVSTTLTVAPRIMPKDSDGSAFIGIHATLRGEGSPPSAHIYVAPGGGPGSVVYQGSLTVGSFRVSPQVGDQLTISIYYDQHGHTSFTAADLTQHTTQTVRLSVGGIRPVFDNAVLGVLAAGTVPPPAADTQLWDFTGSRLTTYTGVHGTVVGPWQTSQEIATTTGTATGTVVTSPSALSNGGQNFGVWLRALPQTYNPGFAGYTDTIGPFRFIATTMTVPPAQTPAANGGTALVTLLHGGGPTPRPYANIQVTPGGGAGSISYDSSAAQGTFTVSPSPGDQVSVSIFYDQNGHYTFTVADTTQGTSQTVTVAAPYADSAPLNVAEVLAMFDNSTMTPPPADTRIWQFTGNKVTTYGGGHGSILGPWAISQGTDTTDGTHAGAVVADASLLSNAGQAFGVWLRHH